MMQSHCLHSATNAHWCNKQSHRDLKVPFSPTKLNH